MTIRDLIARRGVQSVPHFTTNRGSLGILDARAVRPRERLTVDQRLEHIFMPNAANRSRDRHWHDYVNLSISRINHEFFSTSSGHWHRDDQLWWAILDFSPEILEHQGVHFTTTNNMYSGVVRAQGEAGFEAIFAPQITRWNVNTVTRELGMADNLPTCFQAEALYPGDLSTEYLQRIYVRDNESADELASQIAVTRHRTVQIEVSPQWFSNI